MSSTSPDPITTTSLSCLCGTLILAATSAKYAQLPIPTSLCHCDSCRHQTGALATMLFELNGPVPASTLSLCTAYNTSDSITRYFCRRCGSNLFMNHRHVNQSGSEGESVSESRWLASAGGIHRDPDDRSQVDSSRVAVQVFVTDPVDGGLFARIVEVARRKGELPAVESERESRGTGLLRSVYRGLWTGPRMSTGSIQDLANERLQSKRAKVEAGSKRIPEKLLAACHCKTIQFHITRPNPAPTYSDEVQIYLKQNGTKYDARFCTCWSCRAATGLPIHPWAYVPPANIVTTDNQAITFGTAEDSLSQLPGIAKYKSSRSGELVIRSFCGTCGATMFYEHEQRPWVIDISVGILRSESGAMAEDFLEWDFKKVSWREECQTRELLEAVVDGQVSE